MDASLLISSVSGAVELGKLLVNERDRQKAAAIQSDLTDKLIQAQSQISQVLGAVIEKDGRIQSLTERVRELEAQQSERARYKLAKLGTLGEIFAYQLRPAPELVESSDEPTHFLCQPCFDSGKKGILQIVRRTARCPSCDTTIQIEAAPPSAPIARRSTGIDRSW